MLYYIVVVVAGRKLLLDYCFNKMKMDVNSRDMYKRTPLLRAIEGNRLEIVRYLLEKGANLDALPTTNKNILHVVAEAGNLQICELLLTELKVFIFLTRYRPFDHVNLVSSR